MDIEEFLREGGAISYPYKREKEEWVGTAKLHVFAGYYKKPVLIFDNEYERHEFRIDNFNEAIAMFKEKVFCEQNLMYLMNPAVCHFTEMNRNVDLDREEDYDKVEKYRQELLHIKSKQSKK